MILTKPGNGGHGLEAYDDTTGKYAEVSCFFNGKEVKTWEEYRDAILDSNSDWKNAYESNPNVASQFDTMVQDQMFPELLQEHVDKLNKENEKYVQFDSPEDAAENLDKLFTDSLIDNLIDNGITDNRYLISVNPYKPDYQVSTIASCVQMNRYKGNNRMNPITRAEYEQRMKNTPKRSLDYSSSSYDLRTYIASAKEIPVNRNMLSNSNATLIEIVKRSFYDPNSNINSLLSRIDGKNCSYFGSCIYMATGGYEYGRWSLLTIRGIVKNEGLKIAYCPRKNEGEEIDSFRNKYNLNRNQINDKIINKLTSTGKINNTQAEQIINQLEYEIRRDAGLCAMLMGYDAIAGEGYQFDILNPTIVDMVVD